MATKPDTALDSPLPRHVAIVMDGNGRWAERRGLPRTAGHRAGVNSVRSIVESCVQRGVEALTLFAFSSENWQRPPREVDLLMDLFLMSLRKEARQLRDNGVRLQVIGGREALSAKLQQQIQAAEALTAGNSRLELCIAANYGGRWDLVQAARRLADQVAAGRLRPEEIDETHLAGELSQAGRPYPDLFIRTGGERRISNFLLWQLAYSELYFTDTLWPDFDDAAFAEALVWFAGRQRRFGKVPAAAWEVQGA
jgi:undecaprenyl diphosphate synthase